jgi:hypothetical protein
MIDIFTDKRHLPLLNKKAKWYTFFMQQKQTENDIQVKLTPLMGMRPGVYLTILYSLILLTILFFLLVFPGLRNPGAILLVKTEPYGAAIRVDGIYMGISGDKVFIPKGSYTIEAVMPGFESQNAVHQIPVRVFGSLFFPRVYEVEFTLKTDDPAAVFAAAAVDFAAWTFAGEPTVMWQIPMSLSEGAYRIGPYAKGQELKDEFQEILKAAARFTVTRAALRDLIRAKVLLDNYGLAPSPISLVNSISDVLVFLSENPGSAQWLHGLLPPDSAASAAIEASNWYNTRQENERPLPGISRRITFRNLNFIYIKDDIMICETAVPRSLFEAFLNENPEWREHKTDYVDEEIAFNPFETINSDAVTGITWYAAEAFCNWLTMQLPPSMANMEVRLPKEDEWSMAAQIINNMSNPGWEWCIDLFAPLSFIKASPEAIDALVSAITASSNGFTVYHERSLRGRASASSAETRASLPPDLSSPFVTFRPVIAPKK